MTDFFETVAAMRREGRLFAVATVVGRRPPVSAHLGDRAIIFADGRMEGFVGGACSREIIRKQALESMRARHAYLVSIRPAPSEPAAAGLEGPAPTDPPAAGVEGADPEHIVVPMTCVSEGAVDVYVEPFVPARRLVVVGTTPVADALTRIALSLDYEVVRVVASAERRDLESAAGALGFTVVPLESLAAVVSSGGAECAAVVASQGHYDEEALEAILESGASYVGLVASRKRGATVRAFLEGRGVPGAGTVRVPAGLDLGARTAPEVALSILAEIVQANPRQTLTPAREASGALASGAASGIRDAGRGIRVPESTPSLATELRAAQPGVAVDPVCKMDVDVATARHTADVGGTLYYFCCAQCRVRFTSEPERYLESRP